MKDKQYHLTCSKYNKKRLTVDCKALIYEFHNELKGINLSNNAILEKLIDYYIANHTNRIIFK